MDWTEQEMNEVYLEVQKRAVTDQDYRDELLRDPNAAIESLTGKRLPQGFSVKVVENEPGYAATFVLPDLLAEEIEDDGLETVAGGLCWNDGKCVAVKK